MATPTLPPPSFASPEGPYTLQPHYFPTTYLPSTAIPTSANVPGGAGAMIGAAVYSSSSPSASGGASFAGSGLAASAAALAGGGAIGFGGPGLLVGTAGGNGLGGNGAGQTSSGSGASATNQHVLPPVWPIRATYVSMMITGKHISSSEGGGKSGGLGGLLGLGGGGNGGGTGSKEDRLPNHDRDRNGSQGFNNEYEPSVQSSDNSNPMDGTNTNSHQDYSASLPSNNNVLSMSVASALGGVGGGRGGKKKEPPRPKNNFRSTSSTFITRVHTHEAFVRLLSAPSSSPDLFSSTLSSPTIPTQPQATKWVFLSTFKHLSWCLVDPSGKTKDPLMRITFSSPITAHTYCEGTRSPPVDPARNGVDGRLDLVVGFASGDLVWLDPLVGRYSRLNKQGIAHPSPVAQIRHHPHNPTIIYVLHADGLLFTYSTDREDVNASSNVVIPPWIPGVKSWTAKQSSFSAEEATLGGTDAERRREIAKAKDADRMFVWRSDDAGNNGHPAAVVEKGGKAGHTFAGKNPLAVWKVGSKGIKQFEFSPDGQVLAAVSDDGTLKIVDVANESILDTYAGYFGGLTCLAWSPDGRFVLTGGQDDLITIISPRESRVVARCQGHYSFVSSIAFDRRRSNARGYRFGSVGEDGRIILWDFSSASLHRPRHAHGGGSTHHRVSLSSTLSLSRRAGSAGHLPLEVEESPFGLRYHPAPMRGDVALIQPVSICLTEPTVLSNLTFFPDSMATCSRMGNIRFWTRPMEKSRAPNRPPGGMSQTASTSNVCDPAAGVKDVKDRLRLLGISGRDSRKTAKA